MRRFGSIFPFLEQGASNLRLGRLVANHDFVKALLKYGSFDEYVFGHLSQSSIAAFAQAVELWNLPGDVGKRIRAITYFELPQMLRQNHFQVFHLGGWGYFAPGLHYLRSRYAANPWPITAVTHSLTGRQSIDHAVRLCKAGMAAYDSIFCTSLDGQKTIREMLKQASSMAGRSYAGKLDHLPLGIDDDLLKERRDKAKCREQMRIPTDSIVILLLGRITPSQKMDLAPVLNAIAKRVLPAAGRPLYLIIGGGADSANLKLLQTLVREYGLDAMTRIRANFTDQVKADLFAAADIFLSLSDNHQETFGLSILEAQGCGLPVVASRFDGYKDLVREGDDGFLIDTYGCEADPLAELFDMMDPDIAELIEAQKIAFDARRLSERMLALIHNDELRRRMGETGRKKVLQEFAFSKIIARYESRWDELQREAAAAGLPETEDLAFQADQSRIFGHYVSKTIQPGDLVVAHPSQFIPASYNEVNVLLDSAQLQKLLHEARTPIRVQDLLERVPAPQETGWFMVMWLLKNDLLHIALPS